MIFSNAEEAFALLLKENKIKEPRREFRFHAVRRWRFDFAWPDEFLAAEIEGILFGRKIGRHQSGNGFIADAEKYFTSLALGWTVIRIPGPFVMQTKYWPIMKQMIEFIKEKTK